MKYKIIKIIAKTGRPFRNVVGKYLKKRAKETAAHQYHIWANEVEQSCFVGSDNKGIKFSIVVPAFNTDKQHLLDMVYSVVNQHHENWELIIANASTERCQKSILMS